MDQVMQQAAAQTERLLSTARALATQAEQLQVLVARFRLDRDEQVMVGQVVAVDSPRLTGPTLRVQAAKPSAERMVAMTPTRRLEPCRRLSLVMPRPPLLRTASRSSNTSKG
jgi:hypothetical protein